MPNSGINVVFFGTEEFSLSALTALVDNGFTVAAVVTKPDQPHGRGLRMREPAVKTYATAHNIPVHQPTKLAELDAVIEAIPHRIGVLSSYGKIIPQVTLDLFEHGIINVHPSLLPKYRGPSPIESALLHTDTQTGVSIMRLVSKTDAGPVYAQTVIPLTGSETASELYKKCAQTGSTLLLTVLENVFNGAVIPVEQHEADATYTKLLNKHDGLLNLERMTAEEAERHVRAYELYPRTRFTVHGHEIIITRAHVAHPLPSDLSIRCAHDSWLIVDELVAPSGRRMNGQDFLRGYTGY